MGACVSGSALAQMVPSFSSSASSSGLMREELTSCLYSAPKGPDSSRKTTCSRTLLLGITIRFVCVTTEWQMFLLSAPAL